jgi:hypothetical protein
MDQQSTNSRRKGRKSSIIPYNLKQFINCPKEMQPSKSQGVIGDTNQQYQYATKKFRSCVESVRRSRESATSG